MIYFIDDDINQMRPFRDELEFRGFEVKSITNADDALIQLEDVAIRDVELVIMDVMIGTGPKENSQFTREETKDFLVTGLILIEKLMKKKRPALQDRIVIFSMAHQNHVIEKIVEITKKYGIPLFRKPDYADLEHFGNTIIEKINNKSSMHDSANQTKASHS